DARGGLFAAQVLADGDVFHLGRDDARLGVFVLGDGAALDALEHAVVGDVEAGGQVLAAGVAVVLGLDLARVQDGGDVAAIQLPGGFDARQALLDVDGHGRVGVGARRVVHRHRRLIGGRVDGDLAEGDADVGEELARHIDLLAACTGAGGDGAVLGGDLLAGVGQGDVDLRLVRLFVGNVDIHLAASCEKRSAGAV